MRFSYLQSAALILTVCVVLVGGCSKETGRRAHSEHKPWNTVIVSGPEAVVDVTGTSFVFAFVPAGDKGYFFCSLDEGVAQRCPAEAAFSVTGDGVHTLAVTGVVDTIADLSPARWAWILDRKVPTGTVKCPAPFANTTAVDIHFMASESVTGKCQLDNEEWRNCQEHESVNVNSGTHRWRTRVQDWAGNQAALPDCRWEVDLPPKSSWIKVPPAVIETTAAEFRFTGIDDTAVSRYICQLSNLEAFECTSPLVVDGLTDGAWRIEIRAWDNRGQPAALPLKFNWTVRLDLPPITRVYYGPGTRMPVTDAVFYFGSADTDVSAYLCKLDNADEQQCIESVQYSGLAEGVHRFQVRAIDSSGQQELQPPFWEWEVTHNSMIGWRQISVGRSHTCGVRNDGSLWCWGLNQYGQLGLGSYRTETEPVQISAPATGGDPWLEVSSGRRHTCARQQSGRMWCWGGNEFGQAGAPLLVTSQVEPAEIGSSSIWAAVASGDWHSCALDSSGLAWCWGLGDGGRLGTFAGEDTTAPTQAGGAVVYASIAAGAAHSCAVRADGTGIYCWGHNESGQLGSGTRYTQWLPAAVHLPGLAGSFVAAGGAHTCATTSDQSLWCWGEGVDGQLGVGSLVSSDEPLRVFAVSEVTSVAAGGAHSCAISGEGRLWCWGSNSAGQLGAIVSGGNSPESMSIAVEVGAERGWNSVAAGTSATCALDQADFLWCWGSGGAATVPDSVNIWPQWVP